MHLTREGASTRWLVLVGTWLVVLLVAAWHARLGAAYVDSLDRLGRRGPVLAVPLTQVVPAQMADAQSWLLHALALQEGAPAQVRRTWHDNAPAGREVHWNSGLAHALAAAGRLEQMRSGGTLPRATERAAAWFNLALFLAVVVSLSAWAAGRAGAGAGLVVALGALGSHDFFAGFFPYYVDHHGVLSAAVFGLVLGMCFAGAGWWGEGHPALPSTAAAAIRAAGFSAASGAVGMWISAATVIPVLAIIGLGGVVAAWCAPRSPALPGVFLEPAVWRWWGRIGACLCTAFYLLEYAPGHLGLRLEVNHPLYALAWWSGGELIAHLLVWRTGQAKPHRWRHLVLPALGLAAAPLTILLVGARAFVASDPFVARLSTTVGEGLSLGQAVSLLGWGEFFQHFNTQLLPLAAAGWLLFRPRWRSEPLFVFAAFVAAMAVAMGVWKLRWWLNAGGPALALLLVLLAIGLRQLGPSRRWAVLLAVVSVCHLPDVLQRLHIVRTLVTQNTVQAVDLAQPLYRDLAASLRASRPSGSLVVLASPNASAAISYFARCQTLGTLYWENTAGLKAAAGILCARTDAEALALLQERGVTHLALTTHENYLAEYLELLHPGSTAADLENTFGHRVLFQHRIPPWLRALAYRPPPDLPLPGLRVLLLEVAPGQSDTEARWHLGEALLAAGDEAGAESNLRQAITTLPAAQRPGQLLSAGNLCYRQGWHGAAVRFFRAALAAGAGDAATRNLAWVLATSRDDRVRQGREALALVWPLAGRYPDDHDFLSLLAAALAETGRFAEAAAAATRALELTRTAGEPRAIEINTARLAGFQAGRPWRQ